MSSTIKQHKPKSVRTRRGVATLLAMMFLVIFGSLVAAMSIASTGNTRTAATHLHVMRAQSAAETGMAIAEARFEEAASRFVMAESDIDAAMVQAIWKASTGGMGTYTVTSPAPSGYADPVVPKGISEALKNHFDADVNIITAPGFIVTSSIAGKPADASVLVYETTHWLHTPAVALERQNAGDPVPPPAFQVRYAPLKNWTGIRVIVDGIVFEYGRNSQPIVRTIMRDYQLVKSIDQAILSNSRILIGKNVTIDGDMGTNYDQTSFDKGDPIVMRSDFEGLDGILDAKLADLYAALALNDVDDDNRFRLGHPVEGAGIPADQDYDSDGNPDGAFQDITGDGYLDDFDVFIRHFDADNDHRVTLSAALIAGTPAGARTPEFVDGGGLAIDDDLGLMIDSAHPDRNRNRISGYNDADGNGKYDPATESQLDYDLVLSTYPDRDLGYRDGFIDAMDQYAKVTGSLIFKANQATWITDQGDYADRMRGPLAPGKYAAPMQFDADTDDLPLIDQTSFSANETAIMTAADGSAFWTQVASQLGTTVAAVTGNWNIGSNPAGPTKPWFRAVWTDADFDGLPDNHASAYFEQSPYNSPVFADYYHRPVFRRFTFRNVQIPMGLNALFEDCTFVGATYVRTKTDNGHVYWNEYGAMNMGPGGRPVPRFERYVYGDDPTEPAADAPGALPGTARPPAENVLMTLATASPIDKGDVLISQEPFLIGITYADLPIPLLVAGKRIIDTKALSNNIRFHDSLFVGSIVSDTPSQYTQVRNKLQFTGATRFTDLHPDDPLDVNLNPDPADMDDLAKSSMMLPHYSVDIGSFNSPPEQSVHLNGAIVAGVLDVRGNTDINGALLLTFNPVHGVAPLVDPFGNPVGNPAGFNTSLGYFGEDAADYESLDPSTLPIIGGQRIVGWDTNGDGLVDLPHTVPKPPGATNVPFNGYGRIHIKHDPWMVLPDGLMLPMSIRADFASYKEGHL